MTIYLRLAQISQRSTTPGTTLIRLKITCNKSHEKQNLTIVLTSKEAIKNTLIGTKLHRMSRERQEAERHDNRLSE